MTTNYLEDTLVRLTAIEDEIHVLLGKTPSAKEYGLFSRDAYPYWRNIIGETRITRESEGYEDRTHTIFLGWTLGVVDTGREGRLEDNATSWIVTVLDYFQARPTLYSETYPTPPRWLYGTVGIISVTGVVWGNPSKDGAKQTAYVTFTQSATFRVRSQRS